MLDLLIYRGNDRVAGGDHRYQICGKTCLAGDIFGDAGFTAPLRFGDRLSIGDAAPTRWSRKNWFNGVNMPSIAVRELDGSVRLVRGFSFDDYVASLS